tara:strand:+ start:1310 stop:2254 length:945 start_codon:yes stop_codon:yes gene_type:complete
MANFTGKSIQNTYQRVLQLDTGSLQDGLGNVVNIPISQLSGSTLISSSIQIASDISGSSTLISGALATRLTSQESFSSSLNTTFATDAEISAVSSSLLVTLVANSASLATSITTNGNSITSNDTDIATNLSNINTLTLNTGSYASLNAVNHFGAGQYISGSLFQSGAASFFQGTINIFQPSTAGALANLNVYFDSADTATQVFAGIQLIDQGGFDAKMEVTSYTGVDGTKPVFRIQGGGTGSNADNTILRSFHDGRFEVTKTLILSSSQFLELQPSPTLPASANTGSFAITGSTLAFYNGNNWVSVATGSNLPL